MAIKYAAKDVANQISELMLKLASEGWDRPAVEAATGYTPAQQWRVTHKRNLREDEVEGYQAFLAKIEAGELKAPEKAKRGGGGSKLAALEARVAELEAKLAEANQA